MPTRVLYDWWGSMSTPRSLWSELRAAGVEVREFNRFSAGAPLEVALRDHGKSLVVDGEYASVGGICIADEWLERSPETGLPYRDRRSACADPRWPTWRAPLDSSGSAAARPCPSVSERGPRRSGRPARKERGW